MQSVLVLHNDPRLDPFLARASSADYAFREFSLQDCKSEDHLIEILPPQVQLADAVLVDLVSLQILGKWILAWLRTHQAGMPVVVRALPEQLVLADLPPHWTFFLKDDPIERVRQVILTYLSHRQLLQEVLFLKENLSRRTQASPALATRAAAAADSGHQYREAFVNLSRLLGSSHDLKTLGEQVLSLLREMFGVGKLALFLREREVGLFRTSSMGPPHGRCTLLASLGIPRDLLRSFHLSMDSGIGRHAAADARIVRRDPSTADVGTPFEPQIQKEFQVMGTEFAVPILDLDNALGVLSFGGKVTGEPFSNEELGLIFNLMTQLGMMISNIWLHHEVTGQQTFMQDVLRHIQNGVVVISSKSKIAALNRRGAELLGVNETASVGADVSWLPSQVSELLYETLRAGKVHQQSEVALQKTGRILSVSTSKFATRAEDSHGESGSFAVAVMEDITELKRQHQYAREHEQQEFILQLASRLSHELKNSLVSINTFAQLLPQQYERKEFRDEFFKIVAHEVTRVDLLVENLTFFAHPLVLRYEEVDLAELIEGVVTRVVDEYRRQHGGNGVTTVSGQPAVASVTGQPIVLNKRFSHTARKIACDPKRLALAIHNLMHNAIQAMPQGGRLSVVTDDAKPNGHTEPRVTISVIDTGEGIALANLEAIFQPFFTTRNVGVGLGLTIAQKIVVKHSGTISVESKLGKGTTMVVAIPTQAPAAVEEAPPLTESQQTPRFARGAVKPIEPILRT